MNISEIFIKRPIMTTLVVVWLVIVSIGALFKLPVNALPNIDFPTLQVSASLSGASPKTMAQSVALPLEQAFSSVPGLVAMNSTNNQGSTQLVLEFDLSVNIDVAAQDVNTAITSVTQNLPKNLTSMPSVKKVNPSEFPIMVVALSSKIKPLWQLNKYADTFLIPKLGMIKNVGLVTNMAPYKHAIRILLDPYLLKNKKLSIDQIATIIQQGNANQASGLFQTKDKIYSLEAKTQLITADDFANLPIDTESKLHLKDIATVKDGLQNQYVTTWFNEGPSIIIAISRQPGSNAVDVASDVKKMIPILEAQMPEDTKISILVDRTVPLDSALMEMKMTSFLAMFLVIFVLFLFLKSFWITLIPALSIPLSVLLTFMLMKLSGFSLNYLTLMALTLSIGFVIDDAIVVLENIMQKREQGMNVLDAAFYGSKEISFTVISMTLSLIAVFIPILFMSGIIGRLFFEFAMTITYSIIMSGFVALTVIPMLSQYIPHNATNEVHYNFLEMFQNVYQKMENMYYGSLLKCFKFKKYILHFLGVLLVVNGTLYYFIPKGFFPNEDTGIIAGAIEVLPETSFALMKEDINKLSAEIYKHPSVMSYNASFGSSSSNTNEGKFYIILKEKHPPIDQLMREFKEIYKKVPDLKITNQVIQNLRIGGKSSKSQYQYTLQSQSFDALVDFTPKMMEKMKSAKGFEDVNTDLLLTSLKSQLSIDRDNANRLGIKVDQIQRVIQWIYGEQQISQIYEDTDTYSVILDLKTKAHQTLDSINELYLKSDKGDMISFNNLIKTSVVNAPLSINHFNRLPSVTISFNLNHETSLEEAIVEIRKIEKELLIPTNINTDLQGTAKAFESSMRGQIYLLLAAIFTIYVILGILYESFKHPITILTGLPLAGIGALICLWLFGGELNLIGIIGLIMLMGIVKKNAIMMIDCAVVEQKENNLLPKDAIIFACKRRFRPIMMTTFAALVSAIPLAFWSGSGAELRRPLGITMIGGLILSQWLTLYLTPLFYVWMEDKFSKS